MIANFSAMWNGLGSALGNHLWQSTLFAIIAWLLTLFLRKNQARTRYWIWLAASLKFLLPCSVLVAFGSYVAPQRSSAAINTGFYWAMEQLSQPFAPPALTSIARPAPAMVSSTLIDLLPILLAAVWLGGFVAVLLIWRARWRQMSTVVRQAEPLREGREVEALHRLLAKAGVKQRIKVLLSHGSLEPGILGFLRPVLLWPAEISERLRDQHLEAILAHELGHVRRRDNLTAALHMLVEAIFWFHPLVWWLGARLVEERERACDEEVLAFGSQRQVYAESILKTCEFCVEAPLACISGVTGADLKKRVVRIMTQGLAEKLSAGRKLLLVAAGLAAIVGPVVLGLMHAPQVQAQSQQATAVSPLSFEVASIKPNRSVENLTRVMFSPDGLTAEEVSIKTLIGLAYNVKDFQLSGGPGWIESEKYDVNAKMDEVTIQAMKKLAPEQMVEQKRLMLQGLLAERFNLKVSHSSKELPIYVLLVAKHRPKFSQFTALPGPPGSPTQSRFIVRPGEVTMAAMPISGLSNWLSRVLGRYVVDRTGLAGNYDFTLHFTPDSNQQVPAFTPMPLPAGNGPGSTPEDSSGLSIFTALQEQLGLKLEPQKGPVEILIIDSVEKPSEN